MSAEGPLKTQDKERQLQQESLTVLYDLILAHHLSEKNLLKLQAFRPVCLSVILVPMCISFLRARSYQFLCNFVLSLSLF